MAGLELEKYVGGNVPFSREEIASIISKFSPDSEQEQFYSGLVEEHKDNTYFLEYLSTRLRDTFGVMTRIPMSISEEEMGSPLCKKFMSVLFHVTILDSIELATLREDLEKIKREAVIDGTTGLYTKDFTYKYLKRLFRPIEDESGRHLEPRCHGIIIIDIDNFKVFNSIYGQGVGNIVLNEVAMKCLGLIEPTDWGGRIGGDEMMFIIPNIDTSKGDPLEVCLARIREIQFAVATLVKQAVEKRSGQKLNMERITVTGGGKVYFHPDLEIKDDDELENTIIKEASLAMTANKPVKTLQKPDLETFGNREG